MSIRVGRAVFCAVLGALLFTIAGSAIAAGATTTSPYEYADPQTLMKKANAIAESEIARLAAAEMLYRNKVMIHAYEMDLLAGTSPATEVWIKLYRSFTGFEVLDIERAPSLLAPLKITIRFDYDRVGTREVRGNRSTPGLYDLVRQDVAFIVHDKESIVREYSCSGRGDPIRLPSPILKRPNIWLKGTKPPLGDVWLEDPEDPQGIRVY